MREYDVVAGFRRRYVAVVAVSLAVLCPPLYAADWIYTVVDGDNLWDFSERYLDTPVRFEQIRRINNVERPRRMRPGTRLRVPMKWIRSNPVPARIRSLRGGVELVRSDGSVVPDIGGGTLIQLGDTLQTAADSSVAVEFADGSLLTLHSASRMRFDHLSAHGETGMVDSRLHLLDGRLDTRVEPAEGPGSRFEIETPSAVSAVRGTDYRAAVDAAGDASNIEVLGGRVVVSGARAQRTIRGGYGTRVESGEPPLPPRRLLPPPEPAAIPDPIRRVGAPLSWKPIPGARAYRVEIGAGDSFATPLADAVGEHARTTLPDLADGTYSVRIRGIDELGLEGRDALLTVRLDARPRPPVLLRPPDQAVFRGTIARLQWTASAEAASYRLEIARDPEFSDLVVDRSELESTRFTTDQITEPSLYHWRITSIAADGEHGPPGEARSWERKPKPTVVEPDLVADDGLIVASWRRDSPEQRHQAQLALDPAFGEIQIDRVTDEAKLAFEPTPGQVRYLRIRALEADGYVGPWGPVQRVDPPPDSSVWMIPILGILGILLL